MVKVKKNSKSTLKRRNISVSIAENIFSELENYAQRYFQDNISMCITYLATKQLETLGYKFDYNTQADEEMDEEVAVDCKKDVTDKCTNNEQEKSNETLLKQIKQSNNSDIKFEEHDGYFMVKKEVILELLKDIN